MAVNINNQGEVNHEPEGAGHSFSLSGICYLCAGALHDKDLFICAACNNSLPLNSPACLHCALPVVTANTLCGRCLTSARNIPGNFFALFRYSFPVSRLILDLKFHAHIEIAGFLGCLMAQSVVTNGLPLPQCLVPVPLHRARVAERGYNQSLEIARAAGAALDTTVSHDFCRRTVNTPAQSTVPAAGRARNLRGAFAITNHRHTLPKHIAIVDDVITTGATVNELALVLHKSGVARIDVWAAARTIFPGK